MLLTIHNLPSTTRYSDVKSLVQSRCGLSEVLLDNLVTEGQCKKVTLGVAEEEDAAMVVRQINGLYVNGKQIYVEKVRQKKTTEQPYRASDTVRDHNYPIEQPGGAVDVDNPPYVPMALNMAFNQMSYNSQALVQDPMMQMMMAQQMMAGMYMMPQQQSVYMGNGSQTPAQLPSLLPSSSQSQYNYQDQNAVPAPNNYSNSKKDNRTQNKSSQNWKRGDGGDRNKPGQGFSRGNPYQQSSTFEIDRRNQAPNNSNEDENRRNVSNNRNKPYQGQSFNRPDERHSPIYDYGNQRPWESDRNQLSDNRTSTWSSGPPENHRDAGTFRNRSRSPRARNTYNTSPQRHEREIYGSRSHNEDNDRYDQAPKKAYNDSKETWSGRKALTEREFLDKMREVPAHKTLLKTARQYYDSAKPSFSHNDFSSANRNQPPEPRKRPYPDSATQSSFGNNAKPFTNREDSIRTPASKPPPQREPPDFKRQKVVPPSERNAPPKGGVPSSGILSLMNIAPLRGIAPSITPTGRVPPLLATPRDIAPHRVNAPLNKNISQIRNKPERNRRPRIKENTFQARIRRSESYRRQAAAHIGKAIYEKCKPAKPINPSEESKVIKIIKGIKLAVYNRIELLLSNELEVPREQIVERYRHRFPWEDDEKLYSAVFLNVEENAAKDEQNNATKSDNAGSAPVEVKEKSSEAVIRNEMPVPKQEIPVPKQGMSVPKQGMPVPKQEKPVPKQGMPVPKQEKPVPKQGMPVLKQGMPVQKQEMPVPKQGMPVPKQEMPVPKQGMPVSKQELPQQSTAKFSNQPQGGPAATAKKGPQPKKGAADPHTTLTFKPRPVLRDGKKNPISSKKENAKKAGTEATVDLYREDADKDEEESDLSGGDKVDELFFVDIDVKPKQKADKKNDDVKETNNDDTDIDDGGTKANEGDTKECLMVGGEEYQIEDEVYDVKEEDLEDW